MRFYFIRGTFWRMGELTYDDDVRLKEIFNRALPESVKPDELEKMIIGSVFDAGLLQEGVGTILKPFYFLGWWNTIVLRMQGVKDGNPLHLMVNSKIWRLINDFFFINASWTGTYFSLAPDSVWNTPTISILGGYVRLKNPLYRSPTETLSKPQES